MRAPLTTLLTGCFPIKESSPCRGAFSAAIYVTVLRILQTLLFEDGSSSSSSYVFDDELVARGYLLASIARALLHGGEFHSCSASLTNI